jgi:hypothetical protein
MTYESVEFEKQHVQVQNLRKTIEHFRRMHGILLKLIKKKNQIQHVTGWTLETLGS